MNRKGRSRRAARRWASCAFVAVLLTAGFTGVQVGSQTQPAEAAEIDAPQLYKLQGFFDRIDDDVDELRADLVLKVPTGFVNRVTGALQKVDGKELKLGYDYSRSTKRNMTYTNTMNGAAGATAWANNRSERYTIHSVIPSGKNDYLVISVEGDMNIPTRASENNVVGGYETPMNWYFSYDSRSGSTWMASALTVEGVSYRAYYGGTSANVKTGPQIKLQWDGIYNLWSGNQANWGQVLDFGLNGRSPGVFPSNSFAVDMVNHAMGTASRGPAGSVSDSFWYAWVHEDGTIVDSVTTAPIRVSGYPPSKSRNTPTNRVSKNQVQGTAPTLAWTIDQAEQGLTSRVSFAGDIDFTDAGGNGYYRLLVWPEARNPANVTVDNGSPLISYTAPDLFDAEGKLTPRAQSEAWIAASAYYRYNIDLPDAPVITSPENDEHTNVNTEIALSGTGTPGKTITLKLARGNTISDTNNPSLTTMVDGDHEGVHPGDVVVGADGTWSYTYVPPVALADGEYTVVALQTDQEPGNYNLTSPPSNPNDPTNPTSWGVTFTIDTVAPVAPVMDCLASPTAETTPTLTGSSAEPGAVLHVSEGNDRIGQGTVDAPNWSYTVDPPLANGTYSFTALQVDRAGNVSPQSAPACDLRVAVAVDTLGAKIVAGVAHPASGFEQADPTNWEITLTDGAETVVMDPDSPRQLARDTTYTIGERLRAEPTPDAFAERYEQLGELACVDGNGDLLPEHVFDPGAQTLTLPSTLDVAEPLSCSITNQTAHASLVTQRVGGQTTAPAAGWVLSATLAASGAAAELSLGVETQSDVATPGWYRVSAAAPDGLSVIGVQALDVGTVACAAAAADATQAPESCWVEMGEEGRGEGNVPQGTHSVFRIVAASPADIPPLPLTGGLGTWLFTAGSAAALACAAAVWLYQRRLKGEASAPELEGSV